MKVLSVQFPSIPCYRGSFSSILLWNTLSLYSSRTVRDHVSHPYKTGKILVLCILTRISFESKRWNKKSWTRMWQLFLKFYLLLIFSWNAILKERVW